MKNADHQHTKQPMICLQKPRLVLYKVCVSFNTVLLWILLCFVMFICEFYTAFPSFSFWWVVKCNFGPEKWTSTPLLTLEDEPMTVKYQLVLYITSGCTQITPQISIQHHNKWLHWAQQFLKESRHILWDETHDEENCFFLKHSEKLISKSVLTGLEAGKQDEHYAIKVFKSHSSEKLSRSFRHRLHCSHFVLQKVLQICWKWRFQLIQLRSYVVWCKFITISGTVQVGLLELFKNGQNVFL